MAYGRVIEIKNIDKFREEILSGDREEIMCRIAALRGHEEECSGYYCNECEANSIYWLCAEYEPPLLKNGDGLKPGDKIMVKDPVDDKWIKRQFAYYFDSVFYCAALGADPSCGIVIPWEQARLPKEGE